MIARYSLDEVLESNESYFVPMLQEELEETGQVRNFDGDLTAPLTAAFRDFVRENFARLEVSRWCDLVLTENDIKDIFDRL